MATRKTVKSFTLIEILIVVIIVGILAAISIPQYTKTLEKARASDALITMGALRKAMERYWYEQVATRDFQGPWHSIILPMGMSDDEIGDSPIPLDVENPNNLENRKWNYQIEDYSDFEVKWYIIKAQKTTDEETWIEMNHDGEIAKSVSLGGDGRWLERRPL